MGIQGLLKGLSEVLDPEDSGSSYKKFNILQFANKKLAVDASSWLFKASYSCAQRLVESTDSNRIDPACERIICSYVIKRCDELLRNASILGIILVFDGKRCPLKAVTNRQRERQRVKSLSDARQLKASGKLREAEGKYKSCLKVTEWMSIKVSRAVAKKWGDYRQSMPCPKVRCILSPYEADAQLAKLCLDGLADAVVTEDSDLLVYSAACGVPFPILYKLDRETGNCDVITMDWLLSGSKDIERTESKISGFPSVRRRLRDGFDDFVDNGLRKKIRKKKRKGKSRSLLSYLKSLVARESRQPGSGARLFVQSCVLTGSDYSPSRLSGVGIVTAFKMMMENVHREPGSRFFHALKIIPREKIDLSKNIDEEDIISTGPRSIEFYEDILSKSEAVFYHQHVLHEKMEKVAPLMPLKALTLEPGIETGVASKRELYFPCLRRFAANISFLGSGHLKVGYTKSGYVYATALSNSFQLSSHPKEGILSRSLSQRNSSTPRLPNSSNSLVRDRNMESEELNCNVIELITEADHDSERNHNFLNNSNPFSRQEMQVNPFSEFFRKTLNGDQKMKEKRILLEKKPSNLQQNVSMLSKNLGRHCQKDSISSISSIESIFPSKHIIGTEKESNKFSNYFNVEGVGKRNEVCINDLKDYTRAFLYESEVSPKQRHIEGNNISVTEKDSNLSASDKEKMRQFETENEDSDVYIVSRPSYARNVTTAQKSFFRSSQYNQSISHAYRYNLQGRSYVSDIDNKNYTNRLVNNSQKENVLTESSKGKSLVANAQVGTSKSFSSSLKQSITTSNKRSNTFLHSNKKRSKAQSIKVFFRPLNIKK